MSQEIFKTTILPCKNKAFSIAYRLLGCRYEAEDVVQDTMLKMWELRSSWDYIDNLRAYTITITKNYAMDVLRKRIKEQREDIDDLQLISSYCAPDDIMSQDQSVLNIENIISKLPVLQRSIFVLRQQEEMSYQQIAEKLEISLESVKINLFRARDKVKKMYLQTV